jgi:hypothetical protein
MTLKRTREETIRPGAALLGRHVATTLAAAVVLLSVGAPLAAVAQAEAPQWYSNGMKASTAPGVPVVSSGELQITFGPEAGERSPVPHSCSTAACGTKRVRAWVRRKGSERPTAASFRSSKGRANCP